MPTPPRPSRSSWWSIRVRTAPYELYDDAGDGPAYARGEHAVVRMTWSDTARRLDIAKRQGAFKGMAAGQSLQHPLRRDGHARAAREL
ncbi:DUF5110 domain-containing protein [Caulobacter segnis]